jgi:FolB domain-containing protein
MSKITICDLEVRFKVGVPAAERARPQKLLLTLELGLDLEAASQTDDINTTIDYYEVSKRVVALGRKKSWKLIETLAGDIATLVLEEFRPQSVSVTVKKFILPNTAYVAVRLTQSARRRSRRAKQAGPADR